MLECGGLAQIIFTILQQLLNVCDDWKMERTKATEEPQNKSGFPEIITVSEEWG